MSSVHAEVADVAILHQATDAAADWAVVNHTTGVVDYVNAATCNTFVQSGAYVNDLVTHLASTA